MKSRLLYLTCGFILFSAHSLPGSPLDVFALPEINPAVAAQADPPQEPRLSVEGGDQNFTLSWPVATNWVLEQTEEWAPVFRWSRIPPETYINTGSHYEFRGSYSQGVRFFRLRKPNPAVPGATGQWSLDDGNGQSAQDTVSGEQSLRLSKTSWAVGRIGPGALAFNGGPADTSGSRAWISNANYQTLPGPSHPFSLSFWFNPDSLTPGLSALAGNDVETNGWHVALSNPGPGTNLLVLAGTGAAGSLVVTGRTLLLPGQWHHLTVTYDGSVGSIYLDQQLLASAAGPLPTHPGPIYFGGGAGGYRSFLGKLDEIRTYDRCLSAEEISINGDWRFDDVGSERVADSGRDGHDGLLSTIGARVAGRTGSGIDLSTGRIVIPNSEYAILPQTGQPFSLSFWIRPVATAGSGLQGLMSSADGLKTGWRMYVEPDVSNPSMPRFHFESRGTGGTLDLAFPIDLAAGVWSKVDITYNGGIATGYFNGRQVASSHGGIQMPSAPLLIGEVSGMAPFAGVLDDLKIYGRERDAAEIGPVARAMWETVLLSSSTNLLLQGFGPAGKLLTYTMVPVVTATNGSAEVIANSALVRYSAGTRKGPDAFAFSVSDGEFTSAPAIVTLSVVRPHWLSPTGGSVPPLDGTSPEKAWAAQSADVLDAIWQTNNWYDCFFYAPGEYQTRGARNAVRSSANIGCKHVGSGETGPARTVVKLVDNWSSWLEGAIFVHGLYQQTDAFEVHHMALDCNAINLPKFNQGEPISLRVPLARTGRVQTIKFLWANSFVPGVPRGKVDRATEFRLTARASGVDTYVTNYVAPPGLVNPTILPVQADADELQVDVSRRAPGADHYGLAEVYLDGKSISVPTATTSNGLPSRFDSRYTAGLAFDQNHGTFWVSGVETPVDLTIPLEPDTPVTRLNIYWKCRNIAGIGRVGPALEYQIRARDTVTGNFVDVPFVRGPRGSVGEESAEFGAPNAAQVVVTDQLHVRLISKEPMVDRYGIKELTLQNGAAAVSVRQPSAQNYLPWGVNYAASQAFDGEEGTYWVSGTQGMVAALAVYGNNLKFTHLRITGFGTRSGKECFVAGLIVPGPSTGRALGNVLMEDCVFTEPAPDSTDGVTVLALSANAPDRYTNAVVRRCTIEGLNGHFMYSHGASAVQLENCTIKDATVAVYYEPDGTSTGVLEPTLIRSNQFINVDYGLYVTSHPGAIMDSITCVANEVVLAENVGWGFRSCDVCSPGPSGLITNFTVLNNIVRYADWSMHPERHEGGIFYSDLQHATFGNNVIVLGTPHELRVRNCPAGLIVPPEPPDDCDFPVLPPPVPNTYPPCLDVLPPGYTRSWYRNFGLSGSLLPVRYSNFGSNNLASQQQWQQ